MKGLLVACMLAAIAFAAGATPPNKIQHQEWSFDWIEEGWYIPCLNDTLNGTVYVTTRSHSFETPSGTVHVIESFFGTGHIYSKITWNTWTQRVSIPINSNVVLGKGQTYKYIDRNHYIPNEGDGRHFIMAGTYFLSVNANGELKVEREVPTPGSAFPDDYARCMGYDK